MAAESYVVKDKNDPGNQGMFSSAGRFTTEKYIFFQNKEKDSKISNKKILKQLSDPKLEKPQSNEMPQELPPKTLPPNKENLSPFYKQTSREYVLNQLEIKNPPKPVGYYKPKYKEIDKNCHLTWNIMKIFQNRTMSRKYQTEGQLFVDEILPPIPEKPQKKLYGSVSMAKCIDRDEKLCYNQRDNPHEKRFENIPMTESWSNIKKKQSFNLSIALGRAAQKINYSQPDYSPNSEYLKKQLGENIGPLHINRPKRKPFEVPSLTRNESLYDYDHYKSNGSILWKKIPGIEFNKQLTRDIDQDSKLPCFMQKNLNSRTNLTVLNRKTYEMNHYMEGRFQTNDSLVGIQQKKLNRRYQLNNATNESIEME